MDQPIEFVFTHISCGAFLFSYSPLLWYLWFSSFQRYYCMNHLHWCLTDVIGWNSSTVAVDDIVRFSDSGLNDLLGEQYRKREALAVCQRNSIPGMVSTFPFQFGTEITRHPQECRGYDRQRDREGKETIGQCFSFAILEPFVLTTGSKFHTSLPFLSRRRHLTFLFDKPGLDKDSGSAYQCVHNASFTIRAPQAEWSRRVV